MTKIAVYTANVGEYDSYIPPLKRYMSPSVLYRYFTDDTPLPEGEQEMHSPLLRAKHIKLFPHLYLPPDTVVSIWHDANVQLRCRPSELVAILGDNDLAVVRHPGRGCIYDEAKVCIRWGKGDPDTIRRQVDRYRAEGYPEHNGLYCGFLLVRRHNDTMQKFNQVWWDEITSGSTRDQISLPYVCWKLGIEPAIIPCNSHYEGPHYRRYPQHFGRGQ